MKHRSFILMNFSSMDGSFPFLYNTHDNVECLGGVGFYIANTNYCILLAGCNTIHKKIDLDANIKALILTCQVAKERDIHIQHMSITSTDLQTMLVLE